MYWLGSARGTRAWSNPAEAGIVDVTCSKLYDKKENPSAPASAVVGRDSVRCVSAHKKDSYFLIDLKPERRMLITHYTYADCADTHVIVWQCITPHRLASQRHLR